MQYRTRHLVAREPFFYDGRTLSIGERFSATPEHAMILEGLSKAQADDGDPVPPATPLDLAEDDENNPTEEQPAIGDPSEDAARVERNRKRRERRVLHTSQKASD